MVAEIIINSNAKQLNKTFDYLVPKDMTNSIKIGSRVFVPFGRIQSQEGFVIDIKEKSDFATKEIIAIEDSILPTDKIELAKLMSRKYFCNVSDCIKLMLPPGTSTKNISNRTKEKTANFVYLAKDVDQIDYCIENKIIKSSKQIRVLDFLKENDGIYIVDLESLTDTTRAIIKTLEKNGYIQIVEKQIERNPFINKNVPRDSKLTLSKEQTEAFNRVCESIDNNTFKEFLVYGITGSRKNRSIYATNRRSIKKRKNSNNASTRNIINTSNGK